MATTANETFVTMNADGTIRPPEETRRALRAEGEMTVRLATITDGTITLHAEPDIPPEDVWLYTPERIAAAKRTTQGPFFRVSEEELGRIIEADDLEEAARQLIATKTRNARIRDARHHVRIHRDLR